MLTADRQAAPPSKNKKKKFENFLKQLGDSPEKERNISPNVCALAKLAGCIMWRRPQQVNLDEPRRTANALLADVGLFLIRFQLYSG